MSENNNNTISIEAMRTVIAQNLAAWRNILYDGQLNVKVASVLEDAQMRERAMMQVKKAIRAIEVLEHELATLDTPLDAPTEYPTTG